MLVLSRAVPGVDRVCAGSGLGGKLGVGTGLHCVLPSVGESDRSGRATLMR